MTSSTSDYDFELPEALIAQHPLERRSASRLLTMQMSGGASTIRHDHFASLPDYLESGDLLVFNDTKVIPARLFGRKMTGGAVEILLERVLDERHCLAHVRASKAPKAGARIVLCKAGPGVEPAEAGAAVFEVSGRQGDLFKIELLVNSTTRHVDIDSVLAHYGIVPLPPYIERSVESPEDLQRYQTVYASKPGAIAAPTAGLHFDEAMLATLKGRGIETAYTTLHVGAGTFQPVRVEQIASHAMHTELYEVPEAVVTAVQAAKARGNKVMAVGTTVVRALESAARSGELRPGHGETDIFIHPGYEFRVIDALLTNFHLPRSTLLMLVSALAGRDAIMSAYAEAIRERYRFFSYGDAMLLY
ncbi:MAG: tRNA preQ1(34) S-adenosylmethionine ribosyltransferase-isomerase QueA [unclassified Hahellaceae]|nr:tRNA preQ1(34) S-adenosylmethionine ribosyltransferase-isomerase QueA [Hahellaceae bacterium]|tara:strand:- start:34215 stop:35297 length:1083 start_codon:yes stop_codon:yes gene_type:complete